MSMPNNGGQLRFTARARSFRWKAFSADTSTPCSVTAPSPACCHLMCRPWSSDCPRHRERGHADPSPRHRGCGSPCALGHFKSAVADRRIASSPCVGTRLPKVDKRKVEPISTEHVRALMTAIPERYKGLVLLAVGTGMRQGEVFGLTLDRVDFLRRTVTVDRQLVGISGRLPFFGPPKTQTS